MTQTKMLRGEELKVLAGNNFRSGYNCAEAVLRAFRDELELPLTDEQLKIASGFGGGLGHAGCVCGALSASIMVLGLLNGRTSAEQSRQPIYTAAHEFHRRFAEQFGATCCRSLNRNPFGTKDHLRTCLNITSVTADLLAEFVNEPVTP